MAVMQKHENRDDAGSKTAIGKVILCIATKDNFKTRESFIRGLFE